MLPRCTLRIIINQGFCLAFLQNFTVQTIILRKIMEPEQILQVLEYWLKHVNRKDQPTPEYRFFVWMDDLHISVQGLQSKHI